MPTPPTNARVAPSGNGASEEGPHAPPNIVAASRRSSLALSLIDGELALPEPLHRHGDEGGESSGDATEDGNQSSDINEHQVRGRHLATTRNVYRHARSNTSILIP